jgi:hypothetical protein
VADAVRATERNAAEENAGLENEASFTKSQRNNLTSGASKLTRSEANPIHIAARNFDLAASFPGESR